MPWLEDFQDNVWSKVQWICLPNSIENFGTDLSEGKKKIAFCKKPIAIQIEFHLCQWNLKKANTLKMLCPISHPLEAHLWAVTGASIRAHGGLLVSGFSCILFLLLSALGFFLCSLWVKVCCTCAHLEGREFTTSRNLWPLEGESHEEILSSILVSGGKFWGAFHMVFADPPIPTMIVSSTTLFLFLSCFALSNPPKNSLGRLFNRKNPS